MIFACVRVSLVLCVSLPIFLFAWLCVCCMPALVIVVYVFACGCSSTCLNWCLIPGLVCFLTCMSRLALRCPLVHSGICPFACWLPSVCFNWVRMSSCVHVSVSFARVFAQSAVCLFACWLCLPQRLPAFACAKLRKKQHRSTKGKVWARYLFVDPLVYLNLFLCMLACLGSCVFLSACLSRFCPPECLPV